MAQDGIEDDVEDIVDPAAFPYRCILLMCLISPVFLGSCKNLDLPQHHLNGLKQDPSDFPKKSNALKISMLFYR